MVENPSCVVNQWVAAILDAILDSAFSSRIHGDFQCVVQYGILQVSCKKGSLCAIYFHVGSIVDLMLLD